MLDCVARSSSERGEAVGSVSNFLSAYSGNFKMALLFWPVVSFLLTLPILAYLYHRDGRLRLGSAVAAYLTVLYGLGIVCFTLYPLPSGDSGPGITYGIQPQFVPFNSIGDIQKDGLRAVFQVAFNVVFFVPLGFIAGRFFRLRFVPAVLLGLGVSALVETAQLTGLFGAYPYAFRCCDVDDLITNTLGAAIGWGFARVLGPVKAGPDGGRPPITKDPSFLQRCVALWIDFLVMGACTLIPFCAVALPTELTEGMRLQLPGMSANATTGLMLGILFVAAALVVEVVVPWLNGGSTPGGMYVRMTCENRERTPGHRAVFYIVRSAVLVVAWMWVPWAALILLVFYAVERCMPYDLLP